MSATVTLVPPHPWAPGTTVSLYRGLARTSGPPSGTPVTSAVVDATTLTIPFGGVDAGADYFAYANGQSVGLSSDPPVSPQVATALDARDYLTSDFALRNPSTTIDFAAAIADIEASGRALYIPGGAWLTATGKNIAMNSAQSSFTYRIFGDGLDSRIYLPAGMGDGEFLFLGNQTFDGTPSLDDFSGNVPRFFFDDFFVVQSNSPNGGFFSTYQRSFSARRINFFGGKYGFRTRGYCDLNWLEQIHSSDMTSWLFQQFDNGDGLVIKGLNAYAQPGISVKGSHGAEISGLVSGWHLLQSCDATVSQCHIEGDGTTSANPLLTIKNSRVHIPASRFYTRSYRPAIRIDDSANAEYSSDVRLGDQCLFVQRLDTPGSAYDAQQFTCIDLVGLAHASELHLENVRQRYFGRTPTSTGDEEKMLKGAIKITSDDSSLQTVISARPPLLLGDVKINYVNGAWEINPPDPVSAIRTSRRANANITVTGSVANEPEWSTNQAAGTRFYRVWTRNAENIDTAAPSEVSITTTGPNPNGKLTISGIIAPATLRILRGTVSGTYTEWIEFPTPSETVILRDQGTVMAGQTWSSVSVPGVTTNNDTRDMIVFRNGTRHILYGSAAPTTGTWLQGDVMFNTAVAAAGTPGWSCVTGGTPGTWKAWANVAA